MTTNGEIYLFSVTLELDLISDIYIYVNITLKL